MHWIAASMILGAATTAIAAEDQPLKTTGRVGGWYIMQSMQHDTCAASMDYEQGAELSFHWNPRKDTMRVFFEDARLRSLEEGREYKIDLYFRKGQHLDAGWGAVTATGERTGEGVPYTAFSIAARDALVDIASANLIGMMYRGRVVASLDLSGSALMVQALRKCSKEIIAAHPVDPFED